MRIHELKCWPESFQFIRAGQKRAEIRMDDRGFKEGDLVHLREYEPTDREYTGQDELVRITHIQRCGIEPLEALEEGYVLLSFRVLD